MSIELETRIAHYERLVDELSGVVADQGRTIDALTREVRRLSERLSDLDFALRGSDDRPPPHY